MKRLDKAWEHIRKVYFPRWDHKGEWKIKVNPELLLGAKCDEDTKTIILQYVPDDEEKYDVLGPAGMGLYHLLIHEICHAVADKYHAKKWQNRMSKAAERACELVFCLINKVIN